MRFMGAMDVLDRLHINLIRLCKNRNAGDVGCEGDSNKSEDCIRGVSICFNIIIECLNNKNLKKDEYSKTLWL